MESIIRYMQWLCCREYRRAKGINPKNRWRWWHSWPRWWKRHISEHFKAFYTHCRIFEMQRLMQYYRETDTDNQTAQNTGENWSKWTLLLKPTPLVNVILADIPQATTALPCQFQIHINSQSFKHWSISFLIHLVFITLWGRECQRSIAHCEKKSLQFRCKWQSPTSCNNIAIVLILFTMIETSKMYFKQLFKPEILFPLLSYYNHELSNTAGTLNSIKL